MSNKPTAEERLLANLNFVFKNDSKKLLIGELRKFLEREKHRKRKEKLEKL